MNEGQNRLKYNKTKQIYQIDSLSLYYSPIFPPGPNQLSFSASMPLFGAAWTSLLKARWLQHHPLHPRIGREVSWGLPLLDGKSTISCMFIIYIYSYLYVFIPTQWFQCSNLEMAVKNCYPKKGWLCSSRGLNLWPRPKWNSTGLHFLITLATQS